VFHSSKSVEWIVQRSTMKKVKLSEVKKYFPKNALFIQFQNPAISTKRILMNQKATRSE